MFSIIFDAKKKKKSLRSHRKQIRSIRLLWIGVPVCFSRSAYRDVEKNFQISLVWQVFVNNSTFFFVKREMGTLFPVICVRTIF